MSSWNGAEAKTGKYDTGGKPPIASCPPESLSRAMLNIGDTEPSMYMFVNIGLYTICVISAANVSNQHLTIETAKMVER